MHGRLRKYVQEKKRKMKIGEAFVGMKRRGSQLRYTDQYIVTAMCRQYLPSQAEHLFLPWL
jgi:hypothetical protein